MFMSTLRHRVLALAVGFFVAFFALPAAVPVAQADNSIILPHDASVLVETLGGQGSLSDIQLDLWSPVTINICPFESCGSISLVSLGSADADTELIFRVAPGCNEEQDFSNDPDHARVIPFFDDQWLIAWDLPQPEACSTNSDFLDFFTLVTLVPGITIPPGQLLGSGSGVDGANPVGLQAEPVNTSTGNFYTSSTDLQLAGIGLPFAFARSYNSADATVGPLGRGWTFDYNAFLDIAGSGDVTLHTGDGQQLGFTLQTDGSYLGDPGVRDALVQNTGGTYTLTRRDQATFDFDSSGELTSMSDRNGQGLTFAYTSGNLTSITDSAGRTITLTYTSGLLTNVALPDLRDVSYAYTGGLLTTFTDVRGNTVTYTYDTGSRLATITDQLNHTVVSNVYGTDGRVTQQTDGRGHTSYFAWDPDTQTATYTDPRGHDWQDIYSGGSLVEQIDSLGNSTRYAYDLNFNRASVIDPDGNLTTHLYDSTGNLVAKFDALGNETTFTYDALNDLTSVTDPLGNETTYDYDTAGNLIDTIRPGGVETDYGRDTGGTGLLTSITDPNGNETDYTYDSDGNRASITDPLGNETTMSYDASGRLTTWVLPAGNVSGANPNVHDWKYTYTKSDQVRTQTDPEADVSTFGYTKLQDPATVTDARGNETDYSYDNDRNLTSVVAADGATTSYAYDDTNNLTSRTDDNGHTWTYGYDDANRRETVTSPMSEAWSYTYDPAGNLYQKTLPSSGTITYSHDADNRLTAIAYSNSPTTPNVTFSYDAAGNRIQMTDGAGTVSYTYDDLNRLTEVTRGSDTFGYGYDDVGNLTSRTYPDSTAVDYTYDDANELATVATGSTTTTYGYDPDGDLTTSTLPANTSTFKFDNADRLTKVTNKKGSPVTSSFLYTLDANGNPTQVVTKTETIAYTYDQQNRLTQVCYLTSCSGSGLAGISYTYDGVGNRLTESRYGSSTTTTHYAYNADDELCWTASGTGTCASPPSGTTTYSYDANGNETAAGSRSFTYDLENRLLSTTLSSSTESYTYDGDGNRLTLSDGGTLQTSYQWDTNASLPQLAIEKDGSGALLRRYVYGQGLLSMTTGGSARYVLPDGQGTVANVTSSTGTTQWTYTYEPYGAVRSATSGSGAATNVLKFDAQLVDTTTGLYDLRARMFDTVTGRLLQRDPKVARSELAPPSGTYVFVDDRPTVLVDPSGQAAQAGFFWGLWLDLQAGAPQVPWGEVILAGANCAITGTEVAVAAAPEGAVLGLGEVVWLIGTFAFGCGVGLATPPTAPNPIPSG
jgi:RHS repeat-associated protein